MHTQIKKMTQPVYTAIADMLVNVIGMDAKRIKLEVVETSYALNGRTFYLKTGGKKYPFWFGINGPRLFFIAYMKDIEPDAARDTYRFCFGGAEKVGWTMNYEVIEGGVSIWATCMTPSAKPLTRQHGDVLSFGQVVWELTEEGHFWVTDLAMMVQSWIRTSQRANIFAHTAEPAPL